MLVSSRKRSRRIPIDWPVSSAMWSCSRRLGLNLTSPVLLSEPLPGTAVQVAKAIKRLKLEGVVAKRRDSLYRPGKRSDDWIKVRFGNRQEFVVGGFTPTDSGFDALLVGFYEDRKLYFAGKVRAGFTPASRRALFEVLEALEVKKCPFVDLPRSKTGRWGEGITATDMAEIHWLRPSVVVEVSFTEWTRDGLLRHAAFVGLRDDKPAKDVRQV